MIEMKNVSKWYGTFQVLKNCTTRVDEGEVVVVCGPSGSGKSTLIKCVNALEPFQQGEITVGGISVGAPGTDLPNLRSHIGMVFQNFELFPHMKVIDNINLAQIKVLKRTPEAAREKSMSLLKRVGLEVQAEKFPGQLSGGQQQRVAIARAVITDPQLIVADEPTGDLDRQSAADILAMLQRLNAELGTTIVMVTHDAQAAKTARRLVHLEQGFVVARSGSLCFRLHHHAAHICNFFR